MQIVPGTGLPEAVSPWQASPLARLVSDAEAGDSFSLPATVQQPRGGGGLGLRLTVVPAVVPAVVPVIVAGAIGATELVGTGVTSAAAAGVAAAAAAPDFGGPPASADSSTSG
ncbi:conserved hypothetical protein [Cupriavidus taiwanensis]|uniref:Uncharacterized protein n=1 Tax=Cupriavidus taiwanensis TaxID=164546 RepID=A0A375IUP4_9BURK|nr:conserved hypothetical protein [Cupriavidus taiwanensis]